MYVEKQDLIINTFSDVTFYPVSIPSGWFMDVRANGPILIIGELFHKGTVKCSLFGNT